MKIYTVTVKVNVPNKVKTTPVEVKEEIEALLGYELELGKEGRFFKAEISSVKES